MKRKRHLSLLLKSIAVLRYGLVLSFFSRKKRKVRFVRVYSHDVRQSSNKDVHPQRFPLSSDRDTSLLQREGCAQCAVTVSLPLLVNNE